MREQLEKAAHYWAGLGYRLLWCSPDKRPAALWGYGKKGTTDVGELMRVYQPGYMLAGSPPEDVVIIDVDMPEGPETLRKLEEELGPLPETLTTRTQKGGLHMHFRDPTGVGQWQRRHGLPGIDTRTCKGYAILPPSLGEHGEYTMEKDSPIVELPKEWRDALAKPSKLDQAEQDDLSGFPLIRAYYTEGQRDAFAMALAGLAIKDMIPEHRWRAAMRRICLATGDEEMTARLEKYRHAQEKPPTHLVGATGILALASQEDGEALLEECRRLLGAPWRGCLTYVDEKGKPKLLTTTAAWRTLWNAGLGDAIRPLEPDDDGEVAWAVWDDTRQVWRLAPSEKALAQTFYRHVDQGCAPRPVPGKGYVMEIKNAAESLVHEGLALRRERRLIAFRNCAVDVRQLTTTPLSRDLGLMPMVDADWRPDAGCPTFLKWLRESVPEHTITPLRAVIRETIMGQNEAQILAHFYGAAGSGKSTMMRLMEMLVGKGRYFSASMRDLTAGSFALAHLRDKQLLTLPDAAEDELTRGDMLKRLTGGDTIYASHKHERGFTFRFTGMVVVSSNFPFHHELRNDPGWARRYRRFHFPHGIEARGGVIDPNLLDKLAAELAGIARWALQLEAKDAHDILTNPREYAPEWWAEQQQEAAESDPLMELLTTECKPDPDGVIPLGQAKDPALVRSAQKRDGFFPYYMRARAMNGQSDRLSKAKLKEQLKTLLPTLGAQLTRRRINGKPQDVIVGLSWR